MVLPVVPATLVAQIMHPIPAVAAKNSDDSVDVLLRRNQPSDPEQNWLATPPGRFKLMLRAYLPGPAIVSGEYEFPPVVEVQS